MFFFSKTTFVSKIRIFQYVLLLNYFCATNTILDESDSLKKSKGKKRLFWIFFKFEKFQKIEPA
jgi:hypothetical protein